MIFPDVPPFPGVPQLARLPGAVYAGITIATNALQSTLWQASQAPPAWGVFDSQGNAVISPDSILDFDNENEWSISTFPVQDGAFASYNKVIVPFEITLRMTKGGTQTDRERFLAQVQAIAGDTNLYTIVTPEYSYQNCNIRKYSNTRRGVQGAFFFAEIDIHFIAINQVASQYTSTQVNTANAADPTAAGAVNQGTVNPQPITPSASLAAADSILFEGPP